MDNRNLSETLPYGKLAMLGIDREKADLLPQEVKEKLLSGEIHAPCASIHPCAEWQCCHAAAQTPDGGRQARQPGFDGLSRQGGP